ncbi:MAG: BREX-1 system adenine-specific DNA-methyltransferase PglX [Solidesulfovibrio sp.]|uniref:BREX-1 system adenine-specific DNA-methyltransferase PglX n=1 Tax=Solidesulfovibrio sp. TaxID=2910990 RepID=UPI003158B7F9
MDKETRNRIQRATQAARALLEREYGEQLDGVYDIRLDGTIATEPGSHLDAEQRVLRTKLVAAVEHERAAGHRPAEAVAQYLRRVAFTTLNRFVALKMLEARGLVQECVSRFDQSAGFKEFTGLAPGLVQLPDHGYRLYIESLFDEIGREVQVLFDRRDPASLLWPRRQTLFDLLAIVNATELTVVWGEDETIGWVYQYFNSDEERRQMRAVSQMPRNSRELAVRNQFFTPRCVVQFLTDNTLGRIWYEMRQGETKLRDLAYIVRRPNEVFLADGEQANNQDESADNDLSQEELLTKTVQVPLRIKKDPRDLKILDPACGSGHFLLYAFDLLERIYEESWSDHESPNSDATGQTIREDYQNLEDLRREAPKLIVEHNLHGIDIDPRAVQIAALALWMRAQKTWKLLGLKAGGRPRIARSNIVTAEPMPGEEDMRREFTAGIKPRVLGQIVDEVFEKMKFAGEAGSLLKIEDEIKDAVAAASQQWREAPKPEQQLLFFPGMIGIRPRQQALRFDVEGITDECFWEQAEDRILDTLREYAERAENGRAGRRRLFAEDAARGFAFINLCRKRYDVVLMNPPFGLVPQRVFEYLQAAYIDTYVDVYGSFVARGALLSPRGRVGAITSRSFLVSKKLERWRKNQLIDHIDMLVDLGKGVMDDAFIDSAMYILDGRLQPSPFIRAADMRRCNGDLGNALRSTVAGYGLLPALRADLRRLPGSKLLYFLSGHLAEILREAQPFEPTAGTVRKGMTTFDDFRFLRLIWEVPANCIGEKWERFAKGGEYANYYTTVHLCVNREKQGAELAEVNRLVNGQVAQSRQGSSFYYRAGSQYTGRSQKGFSSRAVPAGCVMSSNAPMVIIQSDTSDGYVLGWVNSRLVRSLIQMQAMDNDFVPGILKSLPWVSPDISVERTVAENSVQLTLTYREMALFDETEPLFSGSYLSKALKRTVADFTHQVACEFQEKQRNIRDRQNIVSDAIDRLYEFDSVGFGEDVLERNIIEEVTEEPPSSKSCATSIISWAVGACLGRWDMRLLLDELIVPRLSGPFDPLPVCPPGMLIGPDGLPAEPNCIVSEEWLRARPNANTLPPEGSVKTPTISAGEYPLRVSWSGILVDDSGHDEDIVGRIRHLLESMWKESALEIEHEVCESLGIRTLRDYFRKSANGSFIDDHIKRYSKSRRKAPIYWQLSTPVINYSVWLYCHRLTRDTMYRVLNDFIAPKIKHEERKLTRLIQDSVANPTASQRKGLDDQERVVAELRQFHEEVALIAPLWNPDLNDGVIINFAPLWRLVPHHKSWQKECKACWDKLVTGDLDWAHLAMHLWPERVVPKCANDRSLAIAHDLEDVFWGEGAGGKWKPKRVPIDTVDRLIAERTSVSVKAALKSLLEARAPSADREGRRRSASPRRTVTDKARHVAPASADGLGETAINQVREVIAAAVDGVSKADVVAATGFSAGQWNTVINALLSQGLVTKTGERRGARYHIVNNSRGEDSANASK